MTFSSPSGRNDCQCPLRTSCSLVVRRKRLTKAWCYIFWNQTYLIFNYKSRMERQSHINTIIFLPRSFSLKHITNYKNVSLREHFRMLRNFQGREDESILWPLDPTHPFQWPILSLSFSNCVTISKINESFQECWWTRSLLALILEKTEWKKRREKEWSRSRKFCRHIL